MALIYKQFMAGVTVERAMARLTSDKLHRHRIIRLPERRITRLAVYLLNISNSGMMADYRVRVGEFRIYVKVLNLNLKSKLEGRNIGKGAFGRILQKSIATHEFVVKMQKRDINREEIEDMVREVAISKLCSMFEIGPAVETSIPFDMVVYADAVQFHLEKCELVSNPLLSKHGQQFEIDLKECLLVLHNVGVVHRDIKCKNILWNARLNRFVLCDFGLSDGITEHIGQKSMTNYCGTLDYMSIDM
jgi:tRNA A-37 threonylcarbamoyl transferase component Bud32